jgi:hypothetical protein
LCQSAAAGNDEAITPASAQPSIESFKFKRMAAFFK